MNSTERVRAAILGQPYDRQPIYGWVSANLGGEIAARWGSVEAFEDKYEFDIAHLFGGPGVFNGELINAIAPMGSDELTPDLLVDQPIFLDPNIPEAYEGLRGALAHHKARGRFCYVQTPGFFENFNGVFGIENHLMWLAVYPDELNELYRRQAEWTIQFADHCIDLGIDMIHISDDWGAQKDLMFSPVLWKEIVYPHLKKVVDHVHARGCLCSLHSDGCVMKVADDLAEIGLDVIHPWQERAGMSYDVYLEKYADKFAILGGVCVQYAIGLMPRDELEAEIRRVFGLLKGKRWLVCTTHFVQNHCSIEDLEFAYDLIYKLARSEPAGRNQMDHQMSEAVLCERRDEWFRKLQDFFDGKTACPEGFRMLGSMAGAPVNICEEPEAWVDGCLEDIVRNRARDILNPEKFVPVCLSPWIYGVHFMDKVLGGELYFSHGDCNCAYLKTPIGELAEPDLENNETFSIAIRAAKRFAEVGGGFPIFGLPVIASPLNIGVNLYGQALLIAMLEEPEAARRDLETINRTLIQAHRMFQSIIPKQQLQCCVTDSRTQPPGYGQICGCSTHLLSGELYREMVADLDDALLGVYEKGGMIHLCGGHTQHIEAFRSMKNLKTIQLNDRAAGDLELYFKGLRGDQIIYFTPCPEMPLERALEITKGERLVIIQ